MKEEKVDPYDELARFVARGNFGIDQQRKDIVTESWAPDGHFTFYLDGEEVRRAEGRDTIIQRLEASWKKGPAGTTRHVVTNFWVEELTEDSAIVNYYLTLVSGRQQPPRVIATGYYRDHLVRIDGKWAWQERTLQLDGPLG